MVEIIKYIDDILLKHPTKIIISKPTQNMLDIKVVLNKKSSGYQYEKIVNNQAFHQLIKFNDINEHIQNLLSNDYSQLNAFCDDFEFSIGISKKGKILFSKHKQQNNISIEAIEHNKKKNYILNEGEIIEPLIDIGVFTREGKIVNSKYDKFRQINRFLEILDDVISKTDQTDFNIIDFGCGKSYLTFVIYYYFKFIKKKQVTITGLDLKEDVIKECNLIAKKYNYDNLFFQVGDISSYKSEKPIDIVISLHACDTATDYALYNAINWNAKIILSVPCCQHELNEQIRSEKFSLLLKYGIVKERISALMTDTIRANLLTLCGYKTQLVEFIDDSSTPKNILIRAIKTNNVINKEHVMSEVNELIETFNLKPKLYMLLRENNKL